MTKLKIYAPKGQGVIKVTRAPPGVEYEILDFSEKGKKEGK
jgi:hypothetical protein